MTIFTEISILDVSQYSEYTSVHIFTRYEVTSPIPQKSLLLVYEISIFGKITYKLNLL